MIIIYIIYILNYNLTRQNRFSVENFSINYSLNVYNEQNVILSTKIYGENVICTIFLVFEHISFRTFRYIILHSFRSILPYEELK